VCLYPLGQFDVIHNFTPDGFVSPDLLVKLAVDQNKGSQSNGQFWIQKAIHPVKGEKHQQAEFNHGQEDFLTERTREVVGEKREESDAQLTGGLHDLRDGLPAVYGVGIHKEEPFAPGVLSELMAGEVLACPPLREGLAFKDSQVGVLLTQPMYNLVGPIAGVVVQHQNLQVAVILPKKGSQAALDVALLVPSRDEHGDKGFPWEFSSKFPGLPQGRHIGQEIDQYEEKGEGYRNLVKLTHKLLLPFGFRLGRMSNSLSVKGLGLARSKLRACPFEV